MKIGVLGGTFNPIHIGHISLAKGLIEKGFLDKVLFVVSSRPPHKDEPDTKPQSRYEMVCLALKNEENLIPCDIEMREESNYTVETLPKIRAMYSNDEVYFITGADMFIDIPYWYKPEELFKNESFLVADRENSFSDEKYIKERDEIIRKYNPDVTFAPIDTPDISSTMLRKNPEKYKEFLPDGVYEYILKNNLYVKHDKEMIDLILEKLNQKLSEKRLKHTLGVAKCAVELAKRFNADGNDAYIAGLLHDIEKEDSLGNMQRLCKDLALDEEMLNSKALLHGPAGAEYAVRNFNVSEDVYNACFYHTVGRKNMSTLEKIIYLADMIEENRTQPGVDELRKIAETDLDRAILQGIKNTISYLSGKGAKIHKNSLEAMNYLLKLQ